MKQRDSWYSWYEHFGTPGTLPQNQDIKQNIYLQGEIIILGKGVKIIEFYLFAWIVTLSNVAIKDACFNLCLLGLIPLANMSIFFHKIIIFKIPCHILSHDILILVCQYREVSLWSFPMFLNTNTERTAWFSVIWASPLKLNLYCPNARCINNAFFLYIITD